MFEISKPAHLASVHVVALPCRVEAIFQVTAMTVIKPVNAASNGRSLVSFNNDFVKFEQESIVQCFKAMEPSTWHIDCECACP